MLSSSEFLPVRTILFLLVFVLLSQQGTLRAQQSPPNVLFFDHGWHLVKNYDIAKRQPGANQLGDAMPKTFAKGIASGKGKYKKATSIDGTIKATRDLSKLK